MLVCRRERAAATVLKTVSRMVCSPSRCWGPIRSPVSWQAAFSFSSSSLTVGWQRIRQQAHLFRAVFSQPINTSRGSALTLLLTDLQRVSHFCL